MPAPEPKISIIIPNYNRALLLPETLHSILKQDYPNWEAIVVDDGSTDESLQVVKRFSEQDNRIKLFKRNREPKGAPTCRNIGFEQSSGDYIIYLDSDDLLAPYCLGTRMEHFKNSQDADFLVFPMLIFREKPGDCALLWNINSEEDDLTRFLEGDSPWSVTCPIWKRSAVNKVGGWDEEAVAWQDWEFHIKAIVKGLVYKKVEALPDCFVRRHVNDSISKGDASARQMHSKQVLFQKIYTLLRINNKLSSSVKSGFANLLFVHAEKCAVQCPQEPLAENYANIIVKFSLAPGRIARLQLFYIKTLIGIKRSKLPFLSTFSFHFSRLVLPAYLTKRDTKQSRCRLGEDALEQVKMRLRNGKSA